ncbi:MotA/TolQ/ExbB proton channel family protein [Desulfobacterium sp. N47]|uniref:MotA/TolQ/ExbB proton channel domain-containing protein n=1 Tax=uncultured Desulfobacterium sp. TaxID=201089 RepID=E1YK31_9BACT|nr:hypothetical protein N47_E51470 [uncultured Desulfobacterium sp.]
MRNPKRIIFELILTLCLIFGMASVASAWWNNQWEHRKKIAFDTTSTGSDIKENLNEIPVLIRLHSGNFNFTNAKDDGSDIRFVSQDDKTPLKYHIENYDTIDGIALFWVSIPKLPATSNQDFVWMYYGNKSAADGQDIKGTYDVNYALVYHMAEVEDAPRDATAFGNNPSQFTGGQGLPSLIGKGMTLNGSGDRIVIPVTPSLDISGGFTFSTWIRISRPQDQAYIYSWEEGKQEVRLAINGTKLYALITTDKNKTFKTDQSADLTLNTWHHIAVTVAPHGRMTVYLEGIEMNWINITAELPVLKGNITIGGSYAGNNFLQADMDEIRISKTARSASWIRACFMAEGTEGKEVSVRDEEAGEGGGGGQLGLAITYLKIILKNISLDGWMIIGILIIFGIVGTIIFIYKTYILFIIKRTNNDFLVYFDGVTDLRKAEKVKEEDDDYFLSSSLYRIYAAGKKELTNKVGGSGNPDELKKLTPKALNSVKAAIERAYVRETLKLSAWLVFLSMSVAGGPFFGLLGTVWGVMNTFAAMSEAGEANIMAIAPGVASALATTVFGLIVAIPALLAYNYLMTKIKNINSEMVLFVDELNLKIEESEE